MYDSLILSLVYILFVPFYIPYVKNCFVRFMYYFIIFLIKDKKKINEQCIGGPTDRMNPCPSMATMKLLISPETCPRQLGWHVSEVSGEGGAIIPVNKY